MFPRHLEAGATESFSVDVPAPGFLAVEVTTPGWVENLPWLEVLPGRRATGDPSGGTLLDRALARQLVAVDMPGTHVLRVGAVAPWSSLDKYVVTVQYFATLRSTAEPRQKNGGSSNDDDDPEDPTDEIVPIIYIDPAQLTSPTLERLASNCNASTTLCARRLRLGETVTGALFESPGADFYSFTLERASYVRANSAGATDTQGGLYDASGHRLMVADDGAEGENFALTAHLPPGHYFIRVEGAMGASGEYLLELTGSDL